MEGRDVPALALSRRGQAVRAVELQLRLGEDGGLVLVSMSAGEAYRSTFMA